jgi:hypothetical protein
MKNEAVASLLVVAIAVGAGTGYLAGYANERTVTSVSTLVTTSTSTITYFSTEVQTSTTTTTTFEQAGITVANVSVPASAWSYYNSGGNLLQCGYAQPFGSGSITISNTGNQPVAVGDLIIYLGGDNQTEYLASAVPSVQSCTISPSGSLTLYFTLFGPTPANCQYFTAYVLLSNGYDVSFSGSIGAKCPIA